MEENNIKKLHKNPLFIVGILLAIVLILLIFLSKKPNSIAEKCQPNALMAQSANVLDPICNPSDPNCVIDPCR